MPGFYKETGSSLPTYAVYGGGIGIFIRNARGNVVGVQIRKDIKKEGEQRYVWFSSSFAKSSKYFTGGAAAGSPQDILYPQKKKTVPCFCIAEGKFKTEILSRKGNVAMSVQGVGNFSGCEREIKEAEKRMKHKFRTFYVYYDADMFRNMAVYAQAVKLGLYLMEKFPDAEVKYGVWDDADGKGIDDLYFAGKTDSIKSHSLSVMKETWEKKVTELMKLYGIESVNKVPKEVREDFLEDLETGLKKILL